MKLGIEVGLGAGHTVLDKDSAPSPERGTAAPYFLAQVYCSQTAGWIKMPLGTKIGLGPGHNCVRWGPSPPQRGIAPNFRPMSIVAKRSPISATVHLLL